MAGKKSQKNDDLLKFIQAQQKTFESRRQPILEVWNKVSDYINLGLGPISNETIQVKDIVGSLGKKAYNSVAVSAAVLATDGIHGYHVSPAFPWFAYMMSRAALNKISDIKAWLQSEEQEIYAALNNSNFYSEMWPFIYNGFTVGTATIYAEMDYATGRLMFECIHPREIFIGENRFGVVDVVHRKFKMTVKTIYEKFKDSIPDEVKKAYENGNLFQEYEVIHACYPRTVRDVTRKDNVNKPYASVWVMPSTGDILLESGFDYFPYHVWRYLKVSGYEYGLSPAILSMADVEGLNIISKTLLNAAQMFVDPPLNVPADFVGKVQWKPRGINPYDREGMTVKPVAMTGQYPVGVDREDRIERSIRERFHVDTFLMLTQLSQRGERTAYEVSELMGEKAAILGAELASLNNQMDAVLDTVYTLKASLYPSNNGSITPIPEQLYQYLLPGDSFSPVYLGPLAQAQRRIYVTNSINGAFKAVLPVVQVFPQAARRINADKTIKLILDSFNFPQEAITSDEEIQQIKEQEEAQQEQMMQMQQAQQVIEGARGLSEVDKNTGNVLTQNLINAAQKYAAGGIGTT